VTKNTQITLTRDEQAFVARCRAANKRVAPDAPYHQIPVAEMNAETIVEVVRVAHDQSNAGIRTPDDHERMWRLFHKCGYWKDGKTTLAKHEAAEAKKRAEARGKKRAARAALIAQLNAEQDALQARVAEIARQNLRDDELDAEERRALEARRAADRTYLEGLTRDELDEIAAALRVDVPPGARKAGVVDALVTHMTARAGTPPEPAPAPKKRRARKDADADVFAAALFAGDVGDA
jgi:hypothetical protein